MEFRDYIRTGEDTRDIDLDKDKQDDVTIEVPEEKFDENGDKKVDENS